MNDFSAFFYYRKIQESRFIKISPEIFLPIYEGFFFFFLPVFPEHSAPHLFLTPSSVQGVPSSATAVANGLVPGELDAGQHPLLHTLIERVSRLYIGSHHFRVILELKGTSDGKQPNSPF